MSIIVFTDDEDANCEEFDLTVDRHDGTYDFVPVEKTSCDRWSLADSYQFRLNNLTEERYGFSASDTVTIVACKATLTPTWKITPLETRSLTSARHVLHRACCSTSSSAEASPKRGTPNNRSW